MKAVIDPDPGMVGIPAWPGSRQPCPGPSQFATLTGILVGIIPQNAQENSKIFTCGGLSYLTFLYPYWSLNTQEISKICEKFQPKFHISKVRVPIPAPAPAPVPGPVQIPGTSKSQPRPKYSHPGPGPSQKPNPTLNIFVGSKYCHILNIWNPQSINKFIMSWSNQNMPENNIYVIFICPTPRWSFPVQYT